MSGTGDDTGSRRGDAPRPGVLAAEGDARTLEQMPEFHSFLLNSVSDGVFVYFYDEPDRGRLVYVNEAAHRARGYTRDEMLRMNVLDVVSPERRDALAGWIDQLEERGDLRVESVHQRKDGSVFPVEVWLRLVQFGRRLVVSVSRDLTVRKRREEELQASFEHESLLKELAELAVSASTVREAGERLADAVSRRLGARMATISIPAEDGRSIVPVATSGSTADDIERHVGPVEVQGSAPAAQVYRSRKPTYVPDTEDVADASRDIARTLGIRSSAILPLSVRGTAVGVVVLGWAEPRSFEEDERSYLESASVEIALGIESARLLETERAAGERAHRELESTRLLLRTANTFAAPLEIEGVLDALTHVLAEVSRTRRVTVGLYDPEREEVTVRAGSGETLPVGTTLALAGLAPQMAIALRHREPQVIDYEQPAIPEESRARAQRLGYRVALIVPLVVGERVLGYAAADDPGERHEFASSEIALAQGIAAQAATAMENVRLFEESGRRAQESMTLAELSALLASASDVESALPQVLRWGGEQLGANGVTLTDHEGDGWRIRAAWGKQEELVGERYGYDGLPSHTTVLRTREPVVVEDVLQDPAVSRELAERLGYRSFAIYPMRYRGDVTGTLAFSFAEPQRSFAMYLTFMSRLAFIVSAALENARLFKAEHDVSDMLQTSLLALPEEIPGVQFAHAYHSAAEAARVGGDFYDIFEMGDGLVGVTVGDVAGKGLDAAVLTSLAKNTIRAHATEKGAAPATVLWLTNDVVYGATRAESFVTVFFGVLDCRSGRLVYASAGHTTGVLIARDGTLTPLPPTGPVLGAFEGMTFEESERSLDLDESLFLYTDGLTEARHDGELFGEERLFELLVRIKGANPPETVRAVVEEVLRFAGGALNDDMALFDVRRIPPGEPTPPPEKVQV